MANSTINAPCEMETGTLLSETWGTVSYRHDKINHICYVRFAGNSNASPPSTTQTKITLPTGLGSTQSMLIPMYGGGRMEVSSTELRLNTNGIPWEAGSIIFPTI